MRQLIEFWQWHFVHTERGQHSTHSSGGNVAKLWLPTKVFTASDITKGTRVQALHCLPLPLHFVESWQGVNISATLRV